MNFNNKKYDELLNNFYGNYELLELIKWCILDWEEEREVFFQRNGKYPEQRNLLMKLKFDLVNKKNEIIGGNNG